MFTSVEIKNYKSIEHIELFLGRFNVFIGENGAGKSNILEAIALAAAAHGDKLDNEFLVSRGIRVTSPDFMRSSFKKRSQNEPVEIALTGEHERVWRYIIKTDNAPYSKWYCNTDHLVRFPTLTPDDLNSSLDTFISSNPLTESDWNQFVEGAKVFSDTISKLAENVTISKLAENVERKNINVSQSTQAVRHDHDMTRVELPLPQDNTFVKFLSNTVMSNITATTSAEAAVFGNFIIYSPDSIALRTFEQEGQIEPLGINGQGLLKFLAVISELHDKSTVFSVKQGLRLLDWFQDFEIAIDFGQRPKDDHDI